MIKKIIIVVIIFFVAKVSMAQSNANSQFATVYFMRSTGLAGFGAFSTFIDDSLACHLNNKRYSVHTILAGIHTFGFQFDGKKAKKKSKMLSLMLKAGHTYYFNIEIGGQWFVDAFYLMEVTENTAKKMLPLLKEDINCK
jgi:hypothetical protein